MSKNTHKARARRLQSAIQQVLGQSVKLSQAYEIIAKEDGFKNWDTACAAQVGNSEEARKPNLLIKRILSSNGGEAINESFTAIKPDCGLNEITAIVGDGSLVLIDPSSPGKDSDIAGHLMGLLSSKFLTQEILGRPANNYHAALAIALRSDPEVIYIGKVLDDRALDVALITASTGRIVIASCANDWTQEQIKESAQDIIREKSLLADVFLLRSSAS